MDNQYNTVTLYASQAQVVVDAIMKDGAAFSKAEYVEKKYGESAKVFLTAYQWFVSKLPRYVPKPEGAEFPYWAFMDQYLMEAGSASRILTLSVPLDEVVLFDMYDWNKIMQMKYIGKNEADERAFLEELRMRGISGSEVMLSGFYPDLRDQTTQSWKRLFRHNDALKSGDLSGVGSVQAGLWCIRKEWIKEIR